MLDHIAADLSILLAGAETRAFVGAALEAAPKSEALALRALLDSAVSQDVADGRLQSLALEVRAAEERLQHAGYRIPRLDFLLPVAGHRQLFLQSDVVHVAVGPFGDEDAIQTLSAYDNGRPLTISAIEEPTIVTFVVAPAERESLEPSYPLTTSERPREEQPEPVIDDFIGIPWILMTDDNEPWFRGNPEIYVLLDRWGGGFGETIRVDLAGVNSENVWYWLGDGAGNDTYTWVSHDQALYIRIKEEDVGFDDSMFAGSSSWMYLPTSGYTERQNTIVGDASDDVRMYLDRD
jgi:hypothetical protein